MFVCCSSAEAQQVQAQEITPDAVAQAEAPAPQTEELAPAVEAASVIAEEQKVVEEKKEEVKAEEKEVVELAVTFALNGQALGIALDLANSGEKGAKILKVKPEGAVAEYNKTAATPVVDGQKIMEAFGVRGNAEEIVKAIQENKTDQMTLKVC